MSVSFNHPFHISDMAFHGLFAGGDDRFEAERFASRVLSCVGFAYGELSDGPAKKIEAYVPLVFLERVGDSGFTGL